MGQLYSDSIDIYNVKDGEKGDKGDKGDQGKPGTPGKDGTNGESSLVRNIYYWVYTTNRKDSVDLPTEYPESTSGAIGEKTWTAIEPGIDSKNLPWATVDSEEDNQTVLIYCSSTTTILNSDGTLKQFSIEQPPKLIKAYDTYTKAALAPEAYAQFMLMSNYGASDVIGWANGQLYIQASFIRTTALEVKDENNLVFAAGGTYGSTVHIAGFNVNDHCLYNAIDGGDTGQFAHLSSATQTTWPWKYSSNYEGKTFVYVGTDGINVIKRDSSDIGTEAQSYMAAGKLFSNSAEITGKITTISGSIGGWNIEKNGLYYGDTAGIFSGTTWYYADSEGYPTTNAYLTQSVASQTAAIRFWAGVYNKQGASNPTLSDGNYLHFCVTDNGTLYADQVFISGTIKATAGQIGGWIIEETTDKGSVLHNITGVAGTAKYSNGSTITIVGMFYTALCSTGLIYRIVPNEPFTFSDTSGVWISSWALISFEPLADLDGDKPTTDL